MMRQRFVLDTTAVTDAHTREKEGFANLTEQINITIDLIADARLHLDISCYIPYPSVYNELRDFLRRNECKDEVIAKIDTWLVKKTPDRYEVKIPAEIFYEYVDFMRDRINKGMTVAEEAIWDSSIECLFTDTKAKSKSEIEQEIERDIIGVTVAKFREKYRNALRYGILDSAPDIDVLLLAKELDAAVVASDYGIQKWAERLGLRYVEAWSLLPMLKEYLKRASMRR